MNSRRKGKVGEREFAGLLRSHGLAARRGQQFSGLEGRDVVCDDLDAFHIECKRVERLVLDDAVAQAVEDAAPGRVPVVAHRRNRGEWLITMRAEDWLELVREWAERTAPRIAAGATEGA